ncbi:MAG: hypothetical protein JWM34_2759 [Ilumatobacteraceae bacterium]|nr:hypothetical protein [Ilumatobacteraceae bacterium]
MRIPGATVTAALVLVAGLSACGDAAIRSTSQFCGELKAHANEIQTPPAKADEIPALITLYSKMGEVAPLEIEGAWEKVYGSLKTANTVDANNPASVQAVADAAYDAQQSAAQVVTWAHDNCGIDLVPAGIVPGGAAIATTTTTVADTSGTTPP